MVVRIVSRIPEPSPRRAHSDSVRPGAPTRGEANLVVALQRTVGNQATWRLVAANGSPLPFGVARREQSPECVVARTSQNLSRWSTATLIQRDISVEEFANESTRTALRPFFEALNAAVKGAYQHLVAAPQLGPLKDLDGHTRHWVSTWNSYIRNQRPPLLSAAFGYAVESLATHPLSPYRPSPPTGLSIALQVTRGGTRPDVVLMRGATDVAWIDITASESAEHIYDKEDWRSKIANFGEVTYPSLDAATISLMLANRHSNMAGNLTDEEFAARRAHAQRLYETRKKHWLELGEKLWERLDAARKKYAPRIVAETAGGEEWLRSMTTSIIADFFKPQGGEQALLKLVPSILVAMGVNPLPFGFATGFVASEKAGEVFLIDHDPELPMTVEQATATHVGTEAEPMDTS